MEEHEKEVEEWKKGMKDRTKDNKIMPKKKRVKRQQRDPEPSYGFKDNVWRG